MKLRRWNLRLILSRVLRDLEAAPWRCLVNGFCASPIVPRDVRRVMLRIAGIDVGRANIWPHVHFTTPQVTIGKNVMINSLCLLDGRGGIVISDGVALGQRVSVITA